MNYQHVYHAGNFADVIKHVILTTLIEALAHKSNAFCYIDTHAGAGVYDLESIPANKTGEYKLGIEKVIQGQNPPALIKRYMDCIHEINNKLSKSHYSSLRYYPGSPLLAKQLIRAQDRIIGCELETSAYQALKSVFAADKQVAVHHMDGFLGLKAFLPPKERRGLILIDPPYENPDEYTRIIKSLPVALKRFNSGTYAIWYPIKETGQVKHFLNAANEALDLPILSIELTIYPDLQQHLNGSGMLIINPPWQFETTFEPILAWLWNTLTINNQGGYSQKSIK